jgi:hypothetical protein
MNATERQTTASKPVEVINPAFAEDDYSRSVAGVDAGGYRSARSLARKRRC